MKCETCKHWSFDFFDSPVNIKVGKCKKVPPFFDCSKHQDIDDGWVLVMTDTENKAFAQDGDWYDLAHLLTRSDFGCVQYEINGD